MHTYDAEMGRTGGGVFNTTLKSGTNNFHGTGFFQTRPQLGRGRTTTSACRRRGTAASRTTEAYYLRAAASADRS